MESSSEDGSFVWTDASNSTSSEDMVTKAGGSNSGGEESEYDKSYKKKLHKELFTNENGHGDMREVRSKKRKRERYNSGSEHSLETSRKKVKVEPESDLDVARVKDKHIVVNGYDEHLLDEKVKKEQEFLLPSDKVKKKKKKKSTCNEDIDIRVQLDTELNKTEEKPSIDSNTEESSSRSVGEASEHQDVTIKKKKKKKSEKREESPHGMEVEKQTGISNDSRTEDTIWKNKQVRDETRDGNDVSGDLTVDTTTADIDISEISKISNVNVTQDESLSVRNNGDRRRLSERLQFEDEVEDSESSRDVRLVRSRKPSNKLKLFAKRNKRLKACAVRDLTEFTIDDRDEVWVVTCPSEVDVTAFRGRSLELGGRCKVKLSGAGYEGGAVPAGSEPRAALLVSAGLRRVAVAGRLALHRRLPRAPDHAATTAPPPAAAACVPLPATKLRHPLLGAHYKKALKLPPAVTERLHAAPTPTKHKRRRKSEAPSAPISAPVPSASSSSSKKKAKRKKHDLEAPETWESERAIEESLFHF